MSRTFATTAWTAPFGFAAGEDGHEAWTILAPGDAVPAPRFEPIVRAAIHDRPDVDLFYADDAALADPAGPRVRLKPAFNPALLAAFDYPGALLIVRGSALARLGGVRAEAGGAGLYDLILRAHGLGMGVERIPEVLAAYPGVRPRAPVADRRRVLAEWAAPRGLEVLDGAAPGTLRLARRFDDFPEVTLVVPTRQGGPAGHPFILDLLDSLKATDWPMDRLRVLVGDDSANEKTFTGRAWPFRLDRVATPRPEGEPFDYAAKMNRLWRAAATEHLVLMNDDVTVRDAGWLKALMTFAVDADVGGVGARLIFPDGRLQHAGVARGAFGAATHLWHGRAGDAPTYQDWAQVHRDWSMVTGAVFATRRSAMERVGGFDPRFTLEFNDLDLALRMRLMGLRIVYTPFAELAHREMASRGRAPPAADQTALFMQRWRAFLADDPAWHPRLGARDGDPAPVDASDWFG
jgi:hypothetical protein